MDRRELLTEVFIDTEKWIKSTPELNNSVSKSISGAKLYMKEDIPDIMVLTLTPLPGC